MKNIGDWIAGYWPLVVLLIFIIGFLEGTFSVHIRPRADSRKAVRRFYWMTIAGVTALSFLAGVFMWQVYHHLLGVGVFTSLMIAFIGQGQKLAKNDDPTETFVMSVFGSPTNIIKRSGWRFFPLRGLVFDGITIDSAVVNEDIVVEDDTGLYGVTYVTADDVQGAAPLSYSYKVMNPVHGRTYVNLDGIEVVPARNFIENRKQVGIRDLLTDKVISAFVKKMATVPSWRDARKLDNGAIADLVKAIAGGDGLDRIPSSVRTDHLMEYFKISKGDSLIKDANAYADVHPDTEIREAIRKMIEADKSGEEGRNAAALIAARTECGEEGIPSDYEQFLQLLLRERKKKLEELAAGKAAIEIPSLGIVLTKVNIGAHDTDPEVLADAALVVREQAQQRYEEIQTNARIDQATRIAAMENFGGTGKDAYELALIDTKKMKGERKTTVFEVKLDKDAADVLRDVTPHLPVLAATLSRMGASGESGEAQKPKGGKS